MMDTCLNTSSSSSSSCGFSSISAPPRSLPESPPGGLNLYGKRRQLVKVQILEREIGLLQQELKSIDDLQPASKCCKEVDDFIGAKQDPLVAINEETHKSNLSWKKLCFQWIWCFSDCGGPHFKMPKCWGCFKLCNLSSCLEKMACKSCCKCSCRISCVGIDYYCANSCLCKCTKVNHCCSCSKACYNSCCL